MLGKPHLVQGSGGALPLPAGSSRKTPLEPRRKPRA